MDLPVLQFFPVNPDWQRQVSGAAQFPPFLHPPLHLAETMKYIKNESQIKENLMRWVEAR